MTNKLPVDILLATYLTPNFARGMEYLKLQVESIFQQDYEGQVRLLIRDDVSTDTSIQAYLDALEKENPNVTVIRDDKGNLGFIQNFECLLTHATAPYMFFADQDDIWAPDKISRSVAKLQEMEVEKGVDKPAMTYHDAILIDQHGVRQHMSLYTAFNRTVNHNDLQGLMMRWSVLGFTIGFNESLKKELLPFTPHLIAHDWHAVVTATTLGQMSFIDEPLAQYRIHGNNTSNIAFKDTEETFFQKASGFLTKLKKARETVGLQFVYAHDFLEQNRSKLSEQDAAVIETVADLGRANFLSRYRSLKQMGLMQSNPQRALLWLSAPRTK